MQAQSMAQRISPAGRNFPKNERDRRHRLRSRFLEQKRQILRLGCWFGVASLGPLLTCDAVIAEASFHVQNSGIVLELVQDGLLLPEFNVIEHIERLTELAKRFSDRTPDLADLCLIRLNELHPRHSVITVDIADFRVYRRNRKDAIPLIHRPKAGNA
jgi:hypothetical protein